MGFNPLFVGKGFATLADELGDCIAFVSRSFNPLFVGKGPATYDVALDALEPSEKVSIPYSSGKVLLRGGRRGRARRDRGRSFNPLFVGKGLATALIGTTPEKANERIEFQSPIRRERSCYKG